DRTALLMDVHHELLGLGLLVAEDGHEHVGDVGHQVDRVVPDNRDPGPVGIGGELDPDLLRGLALGRHRAGHTSMVARRRALPVTPDGVLGYLHGVSSESRPSVHAAPPGLVGLGLLLVGVITAAVSFTTLHWYSVDAATDSAG